MSLYTPKYKYRKKTITFSKLVSIVEKLKSSGKKVVFTNGCFDILHKGHIHYLRASKELGDILVIGLNSDKSVKRLKGESRPINVEVDRAYLLEALEFVDFIVIYDDDTPLNLICKLKPDYYTKSKDYSLADIIGPGLGSDIVEQYGGQVVLMDYMEGYSTSSIISKNNI